jgi:hypothetical protein
MTAITQNDFHRFSSEVQRTATMLDHVGPLGMLRAAANLLLMEHRGNKAISLARAMFEACAHACETAPCVKGIHETARTVRDNYLLLAKMVPRLPVLSLLKGRVSRSLDEWDNLVEDCAIASDREFRNLIPDIAGRV